MMKMSINKNYHQSVVYHFDAQCITTHPLSHLYNLHIQSLVSISKINDIKNVTRPKNDFDSHLSDI